MQIRNVAFYVTLPCFFLVLVIVFDRATRSSGIPSIPLALAGLAVLLATFRVKESILHKVFFILAGGSGAALAINMIVGPVGGGDGGGIFLPMILICPPLFIIGAVGCIVFLIKATANEPESAESAPP